MSNKALCEGALFAIYRYNGSSNYIRLGVLNTMIRKTIPIGDIVPNPSNPRVIKDQKFKDLVKSLQSFPEMLEAREIVLNKDLMILGGNMRHKAALKAKISEIPVKIVDWTIAKQEEFIIKDNVSGGEWDWDTLANEWDATELEEWGVSIPTIKNTELLSGLDYKSMYYEPTDKPTLVLDDCIDLTKYKAKLEALEEFDLKKDVKESLKVLCTRFIKVDFESIANYYAFNATEDEKKAIERLRLVLVDGGVDGFIEDDLIKILGITGAEDIWA